MILLQPSPPGLALLQPPPCFCLCLCPRAHAHGHAWVHLCPCTCLCLAPGHPTDHWRPILGTHWDWQSSRHGAVCWKPWAAPTMAAWQGSSSLAAASPCWCGAVGRCHPAMGAGAGRSAAALSTPRAHAKCPALGCLLGEAVQALGTHSGGILPPSARHLLLPHPG